jgi:flagellar hook assembly protein FlgD
MIEFGLKSPDVVTLRIYDTAGRLIRTLIDGPLPAKHHSLVWNGTDGRGNAVASGVYFYRMETSTFTATRKMVVLK